MHFASTHLPRPLLALFTLALALCPLASTLGADWAGYASADGSVFDNTALMKLESHDLQFVKDPVVGTAAFTTNKGTNGSYTGSAGVRTLVAKNPNDPTKNQVRILLSGNVQTNNASPVDSEGGPPNVGVKAYWFDYLHLSNPDLLDFTALGAISFYFLPHLNGTITGNTPMGSVNADLRVMVGDLEDDLYDGSNGPYNDGLRFNIQGNIFTAISGMLPTVRLQMILQINAITYEDGGSVVGSFEHTADLGTIYVGDKDGNPVPGTEHLGLVGDSGIVYDVQPMPGLPAQTAPVITSAATATGEVGVAFSYQITATNSPTSYAVDALPAGLTLDPATGAISGAPTVAGTYPLNVSATNASGTGSAAITLTVSPPIVTVTPAPNPINVQGGKAPAFVLKIAAPQTTDLRINYVVKGSAKPGVDYVPLKGSLKLKAGKTSKALKIVPTGDLGGAAKKTLKLTLAPGDGYAVGTTDAVKAKVVSGQ